MSLIETAVLAVVALYISVCIVIGIRIVSSFFRKDKEEKVHPRIEATIKETKKAFQEAHESVKKATESVKKATESMDKKLTILDKLHKIEEAKVVYNIHYCNAGIGFLFYKDSLVKDRTPETRTIGGKTFEMSGPKNWRDGLTVERYYSTFEEAVEAEYSNLDKEEGE